MKMNITIADDYKEYDIVEIEITNGHWKYNDDHMDDDEKIPVTLNTFNQTHYLGLPVKDVYPIYDTKAYKETGELVVREEIVRRYDTLLEFLNCRINNTKKDYKKFGWTERTFDCVLFTEKFFKHSEDTLETPIEYIGTEKRWLTDELREVTVKIEVIE